MPPMETGPTSDQGLNTWDPPPQSDESNLSCKIMGEGGASYYSWADLLVVLKDS